MKKLLIGAVCVAVFALLSVGLVGACAIRTARSFSLQLDEKAAREETHPLALAPGQTLRIELGGGDIRIRAGEATPVVAARITAWGETPEGAQEALTKAELRIESNDNGVTIRLRHETSEEGGVLGRIVRNQAQANLDVAVPAGVRLQIQSGSGSVDAEGPFAASNVHSGYGSVRVEKVEGDLVATSSSGNVSVARGHGGSVEATSGYGRVRVGDCSATRIDAKSSSGDVRVEDCKAERFRIESGYGELELLRLDGEVEAKTSSGDVVAKGLAGPTVSLATSYGRVQVEGGSGRLKASSSSGDVRIGGFEGRVEARSGYGSVQVAGVLQVVEAASSSGDVSVSAALGSSVVEAWRIASSYGRGRLELPADLAFDIDAQTNYGKIERGFAVELAPGTENGNTRTVQGKVNGGGGRIEIRCKSGDVSFRPIGR
jgi:DUF4097 and DUF4098 domain-containing protein YvlB